MKVKICIHKTFDMTSALLKPQLENTDGESRDSIGKINLASQTKREKVPVLKKC